MHQLQRLLKHLLPAGCLVSIQVGTQSDIRDQRYRTEPDIGTFDIGLKFVKSDIMSDIGIIFCLTSDIRIHYLYVLVAQWYDACSDVMIVSSNPVRTNYS
jgi:hypothetical protein